MGVADSLRRLRAGEIPLSAATSPDAINLVGTVSVDYLSWPSGTLKQGMEFTTLNLRPATLLAEAWMMTVVYGAMFHVAATEYFAGRTDVTLPAYPDGPAGAEPHQLLRGEILGIRHPATTPPVAARSLAVLASPSTNGSSRWTSTTPQPTTA
jgi:hypothetical protein